MKSLLPVRLLISAILLFFSIEALSQNITISGVTGGVAASPLLAATNDVAVLGVQLAKAGGGANTVTNISFGMTSDPNGKFTSARLYLSANSTFDGIGSETFVANGTLSASAITFTGAPITDFGGGNGATSVTYFLVVNVEPGVTGATTAIQPSLTTVTASAGTVSGTATGTNYSFTAPQTTIAMLSTGLAASPLVAGSAAQGVFGFSLTSTGNQTVSDINIQLTSTPTGKWSSFSLVTSTDASFATAGDNSTIGGLTITPSATEIAISGLSQSITTSATNFFLVANIDPAVNAGTTSIQPSLGAANVTFNLGDATGTATGTNYSFAPLLTIANLGGGLAASPLVAGATEQGVFGFSLTSSGAQTVSVVNVQLSSTPSSKWGSYQLVSSTDATLSGDDTPIGGLTFTPSASQVAITGLSEAITTTTKYYFLKVAVDPAVTGATTAVQPSLGTANVTVNTGGKTGSAMGTSYSFTTPTATFTVITPGTFPVIPGTILSAGATQQVLMGFAVTSNGAQTITAFNFNYTGLGSQFTDEYLYESSTPGTLGAQVASDNSPDGNFTTGVNLSINTTTKYYYLVVDVDNAVTQATASVTATPTQAGVTIAPGNVNSFTSTRTFTFGTSQNSDITFTGGSGLTLTYRTLQATDITSYSNSHRIATFQVRDGGGSNDPDNKQTSITSIRMVVTGHANIRRIALYRESPDETEIAGTDQNMPGDGIVTFNPSSPIRTSADNGTFDIVVRVTFNALVTDNENIIVTIDDVTSESGYSGFGAANAGGAHNTSGNNKTIIVTRSKLVFAANPPATAVSTNFSLTVRAVDSNPFNNVDKDYADQVALAATGGAGTLSAGAESLTPNLVAGEFTWTQLQINQSGTYSLEASDDAYADAIGDATGSVTINSPASTITTATTTPGTICYGTAYFPLSNIVITETDPAGISGSNGTYTFSIQLPSGFEFNQSITSGVSTSGGSDVTIPAAPHYSYPASNIVQFSYNLAGTANTNSITISGLQVRRPHPGTISPGPTGSLNITRTGGNANISGVGVGPTTILGTVSASAQAGSVTFTVSALAGDPAIDANTSNFNINGNPVKLDGSVLPGVFTGSGVTLVSGDYRFNPGSLSAGTYPITYTHTNGSGCQAVGIRNFTVYTSGITNLDPSYCDNSPVSGIFSVDQSFIDQRMAYMGFAPGSYQVDHYVYYNFGTWQSIPSPNNRFDPSLAIYRTIAQASGGRVYIGFAVCGNGTLCNGNSTLGVWDTYQQVLLRFKPNVAFNMPKTSFCADDPSVVLTGSPANSNTILNDFFDDGAPTTVTVTPSDPRIWSFNPAALGGPGSVNITYTYRDPGTGCSNTSNPVTVTVYGRPNTVSASAITSPGGTTPQTCQGAPIGTFTANPAGNPLYQWYSDNTLTTKVGEGFSFAPPNPPVDPNVATDGTPPPHKFYVTQTINGCESNKQPSSPTPALELTVSIIASPAPPVPNFADNDRQYCVGTAIDPAHLVVPGSPGSTLKWYNALGGLQYTSSTPSSPTPSNLGLSTAQDSLYSFKVTQTEALNSCEGLPATLTVKIKPLPEISISTSGDPLKICTTGGGISFFAVDLQAGGTTADNGDWSGVVGSALNEFPTDGKVILDPSTLPSGDYTLVYTYTNDLNCDNSGSIPIRILPIITPDISVGDVCHESPAIIINNSIISPATSTIDFAEWEFGDGSILPMGAYNDPIDANIHANKTTGTYSHPEHIYPNVGTFQIKGTLISSDGCRYTFPVPPATIPVTISPVPVANFTWDGVCVNSVTNFGATTNLPESNIASYAWTFAKSNVLNPGTGLGKTTGYTYTLTGRDTIQLIVTTNASCRDTVNKPVYIVPRYTGINDLNSYSQDFTAGSDGWIAGGKDPSWALGIPTGFPIVGDASPLGTGNAWDTNLAGNSNAGENSWVLSGCFDLANSLKPVVSLDIWSDNLPSVDGAVLQYNLTGNIDNDADWQVVGSVGPGINWYNEQGISSNPGNQATTSAGWTGRYTNWRKAIFKLDPLIGVSNVVFRLAFASPQGRGDGFAFDNVFVGERSRIVLLENFTNNATSPASHNNTYKDFGNAAEVVKIQYHTAFPSTDPVNVINPQMNNARAAFYGITTAPTARMDGDFNNGGIGSWLQPLYDDRVLTPAVIKISATDTKVGEDVKINIAIENITSLPLPLEGVHVFTTIVKKSVTDGLMLGTSGNLEFVYVAQQMLPTAAGIPLEGSLAPGATYNVPEITWNQANGDAIVIFVQSIEGNNKNVYQAHLIDTPAIPDADIVTGTEPGFADQVRIYPNPADHSVTIQLPGVAREAMPVKMTDAYGRETLSTVLKKGQREKVIEVRDVAAGMYFIQLQSSTGEVVRKKILVMHQQ